MTRARAPAPHVPENSMTFSERLQEIRTGFDRPFWVANLSEIFERLSYYAVFAALARYLHEALQFPTQEAASLSGIFGGAVWVMAIFGGALADRIGFRRALSLALLGDRLGAAVLLRGEGALVDRLHEVRKWADGVIFNPGAFTHYSYSLRDAIAATRLRVVEVHLSDLEKREAWRRVSVIAEVVAHRIMGKGVAGYLEALEWLAAHAR